MARQQLQNMARFARRRYRAIYAVTLIILAGAVLLASRLTFDPDFLNLLPQGEEVLTFRRNLEEFGSADYLLVAVRVPEEATLDPYEVAVDRLGERISGLDEVGEVEFRLGDLEELLGTFLPQAMLFLDEDGRNAILAKLENERLSVRAQEIRRLLSTPQSLSLKRLVRMDPLGLADVFLDRLSTARVGLSIDWSSGYLLSADHQMFLLVAKPVRPPQDVDFNRQLVAALEGEVDAVRAEWDDLVGPDPPPFPEVALGGRYVVALGDEALIRQDAISNLLTSMIGVLLLFLFAFRRVGLLVYAFVPLMSGLVLTFGFAAIAFGSLSSATSGVAALLIGLGIDFVIVSYGRFVEARHQGVSFDDSLALMSGSSGRAVVVGGITSAATFYAFAGTKFTGLAQMGLLTGTGILLCMVAVLFLLPAMLSWSHDRHARRQTDPRLFLHGLGSSGMIRFSLKHARKVLWTGVGITAIAAALLVDLEFHDSVQAMRPKGNPGTEVWEEVSERFGSGFEQMTLVVSGETVEEVLELADEAANGAAQLVERGVLIDFDAINTVIPPPSQQEAALDWLEKARASGLDVDEVRSTFRAALTEAGLRREPFEPGLTLFAAAVSRTEGIGVGDFQESAQARRLLDRYLVQTSEGWRSAVYLYPPPKVWRRDPPPSAVELAERLGPRAELTGANVVSSFVRWRVLRDAVVAAILGFVAVAFLLWCDFRNVKDTVLSLAPLTVGVVWMLGGMVALGISMNFMNIFVTTMIIGIGVDYGIHMIHRYREDAEVPVEKRHDGLVETGKAIALAALSTIVGFGSLSFSHYPGLQSMGKVAILGASCAAIVATTILPAFLALRIGAAHRESTEDGS